jgi:hypothetical protein
VMRACLCHVIRVFPNPSQAGAEFGSVQICVRRHWLSFVTLLVAVPGGMLLDE